MMAAPRNSSRVSETAAIAPKQSFVVEQLLATFGTKRTCPETSKHALSSA
jgi:hypothetical protein